MDLKLCVRPIFSVTTEMTMEMTTLDIFEEYNKEMVISNGQGTMEPQGIVLL